MQIGLTAGLTSQGVKVTQFDLATTPAMFMSCVIGGKSPQSLLHDLAEILSQILYPLKVSQSQAWPGIMQDKGSYVNKHAQIKIGRAKFQGLLVIFNVMKDQYNNALFTSGYKFLDFLGELNREVCIN